MNGRLIAILLDSGVSLLAGTWLIYVGYLSPRLGGKGEGEDSDRVLAVFRRIAKFAGPFLCLMAAWQMYRQCLVINRPVTLNWSEIKSTEGRFSVTFPQEPLNPKEYASSSVETRYGDGLVTEYRYRTSVVELGLLLTYRDLPDTVLKAIPENVMIDDLRVKVDAAHVQLLGRQPIQVFGHPGIRFKMHDPKRNFTIDGISVLVGRRIYQLACQFTNDEITRENRERFFGSFKILDPL